MNDLTWIARDARVRVFVAEVDYDVAVIAASWDYRKSVTLVLTPGPAGELELMVNGEYAEMNEGHPVKLGLFEEASEQRVGEWYVHHNG